MLKSISDFRYVHQSLLNVHILCDRRKEICFLFCQINSILILVLFKVSSYLSTKEILTLIHHFHKKFLIKRLHIICQWVPRIIASLGTKFTSNPWFVIRFLQFIWSLCQAKLHMSVSAHGYRQQHINKEHNQSLCFLTNFII